MKLQSFFPAVVMGISLFAAPVVSSAGIFLSINIARPCCQSMCSRPARQMVFSGPPAIGLMGTPDISGSLAYGLRRRARVCSGLPVFGVMKARFTASTPGIGDLTSASTAE